MGQKKLPVDLDTIWETLSQSTYLRALGCRILPDAEQRLMSLAHIPNVPDGTAITTSRATFEVGVPDLEGRLHFATYGDPIFEAILAHLETFDLPACIQRLEVDVPEVPVKVVGYAVAHRGEDGTTVCRFVTAIHDLAMVHVHEDARLTDIDIEPLHHALTAGVRKEYQTTLAVPRIEALNEAAGRSQEMLDYLVIRGIILSRQRLVALNLCSGARSALEDIFQEPDRMLRVRRIPAPKLSSSRTCFLTLQCLIQAMRVTWTPLDPCSLLHWRQRTALQTG